MTTSGNFFSFFCSLVCIATLAAWVTAPAQTTFGPQQVIIQSETNHPSDVHAADLDGDGDTDVLSASYDDDKIAWYANDGMGNFGVQQIITTSADGAWSVYAADLDGDGDTDVLSASSLDDKIAWYANDGMGNFGVQQIITTAADGARSVYAADLDGDGDTDVLSASYDDDKIAWYANDGSGNFGVQQIITTSADGARSVYSADLDGDGDTDVLSASSLDDKIAWYANDGNGNFGSQQIITTAADGARFVYSADLDGDGDTDVLSASWNDDKIAWSANDGNGNFGSPQIITTAADGAWSVHAADLDGDGDTDVLSASAGDDKLAWYANDGSGNFGAQQIITTAADYALSVYSADLDGDGDTDVLSASWNDDKIAWYANDGSGNFGAQQIITNAAVGAWSVHAADLDGDGDTDVLSASYYDDKIAWYENDGSGNFGVQQIMTTSANGASSVYASDLDGDGDTDVLSASAGDDKIAWYANDGNGNFGAQQIITTAAFGARSVYASDLDGDGDTDVLSASAGDDKIAWYANDGNGNFGSQQIITTSAEHALSVYAADIDSDGETDVLSASSYDDKIAWYANDGNGNFGAQQIITTSANGAYSVYAADLDGDGDTDVLSASYWDDKIAWYVNDGSGNFGSQQIITTSADYALSVYSADLDGDGDADVLSASWLDNEIAWYVNDGNGNFGSQQIITNAANGARSVYSADLDGDGDTDVLSASAGDDKIAWYENQTLSETDPLPPVAGFTSLPAPATTQPDTLYICQGQTVQFLNQSQNANAFLWNFGNGATSTADNPAYTYAEPGTYEVTLTAYGNFPQPELCEADAGEWEAYDLVYSSALEDFIWPVNIVNYTTNPNYSNFVVITNANTNEVMQTYTIPLTATQQEIIGSQLFYNNSLPIPTNIYAVSIQEGSACIIDDLFLPENFSNCCAVVNQLTDCSLVQVSTETVYNDATEEYLIDVDICTTHPYFLGNPLGVDVQKPDATWSYQIWNLDENGCASGQINTNGISGIYNIYFYPSDSLNDFLGSCNYMVDIPSTAPRLMQLPDGETLTDTASLVVVVEPGFAPQISCVSTVCEGTVANYSANAGCETYQWTVTGGEILSGQGTVNITVAWTEPPLGSISLTAECGAETCNQPTVAAVPVIGSAVVIEGQTNFCLNDVLQYSAPYFGGTEYQWSIIPSGAGSILSGQGSNLVAVHWASSAATLHLTYQNNLLDCGGTASLAVQPKPAYAIEPAAPVCQGNTVEVSANSVSGFIWSVSGGEIVSGQNSPAITLLCTTSGSVTVSATPVNPAVFCNTFAQTVLTVVPYPQTPETITGSAIICPLQTYTYTAAPPQPNTMFVWIVEGGNITAGQNSPTVQVVWSAEGPYSLSVVRQTLTMPVCTSAPLEISVSSVSDLPFTITGPATACPNTLQNYEINPGLSDAAIVWSVTPPDAALLVSGQQTATATFLYSNTASGVAVVSASYCNLTAELSVEIGAIPLPEITQTDTLCTGSVAQLTVADLSGASPLLGYLWQDSEGNTISSSPTLAINSEGVYSVLVTNALGCAGFTSHRAYQYTSPVAQIPTANSYICIESPWDIDLFAIDGTNYAFEWQQNGAPIAGATTPFYTHTGSSTEGNFSYGVVVTDTSNTCSSLSNLAMVYQVECPGGTNPGDTIVVPPNPQCPPVAGYVINFTITADAGNCNMVTLNAATSGSFGSYSVNWGDGVTEAFNGISATHVYTTTDAIMSYQVVVYGYFIHPVTGASCVRAKVQQYYLPLVARFDAEPACMGEDWVFQCRSYYLPTTGITQRIWDFGDGTPPVTGTQTEAHSYAAPGVYTATLTITNGECVVSSSQSITILPLPDAGFSVSGGQCVGSVVQFTPSQTNLAVYEWQLGNGATSAQTNPTYTYSQAGNYEVSLQVQDNSGCLSALQTQTLAVIATPPAQPITATDTVFCAGLSATLSAPIGGVNYLWNTGQTTPDISVVASGNYTVQVTLPDGCAYTSLLVQVQVIPGPPAILSPASPVYFCAGDSLVLQAPDNPTYAYQWSENDNGQAQNTYTTSGSIQITVTDTQTGCTATGSAQIIASALPSVPQVAASAQSVCEGQSVNLNITSPTNAQHNYQWTTGTSGAGITVFTSGNYGVWAVNEFGCQSDTSVLQNVVVNPLPDAGVFPAGCYAICPDVAISLPPNTASNYQWYYNGNLLPNITGSSFVPEAEGAYWVVMSNGNCTATTDVLQVEFLTNCPGPLPVTLLNFTGSVQPEGNLLHWTTATEVNNARFTLQSSLDGAQFTTLSQLTGAGNSSTPKNYQFIDINPYLLTYYRLLQTDFDGTTRQAGEVITLQRPQQEDAGNGLALTQILPVPAREAVTVTYTAPQALPVTLHLYDLTGRLLYKATLQPTVGTNNFVIDINRFPQGMYIIILNNETEVVSGKLVKE